MTVCVAAAHDRLVAVVGLLQHRGIRAVGDDGADAGARVIDGFRADRAGRQQAANDAPMLVQPGRLRVKPIVGAQERAPAVINIVGDQQPVVEAHHTRPRRQ